MAPSTLSDFIRANSDQILAAWEEFAKDIPAASRMNAEALRDHASGMLQAIAVELELVQTCQQQEEKSKGRAPRSAQKTEAQKHGTARASEGFSVIETVSEFRALRASVLRLWFDALGTTPEGDHDLTRFNEAIDQVLAESIERYAVDKERNTRLFDALLSTSPDLYYLLDTEGRFIYANQSLATVCGMQQGSLVGKRFDDLGTSVAAELKQQLQRVIDTRKMLRGEIPWKWSSGNEVTYEYLFVPVIKDEGKIDAIAGTARDVSERKASEEKIRRSAHYDALTGLPNRVLFSDRLEREVKHAQRTGLPIALLFIDLDGFKEVNDRFGHLAGDQLLQQAARRIDSCMRGTDTVARLGGDEFTVILTEVNKITHIEIQAGEILEELAKPFTLQQMQVHLSGSIGITLYPHDARTPEELVRNADQAMYVAKNAGRNRFSYFETSMRENAWARLNVIDELRRALPQRQFTVYYQPIVDLSTEKVVKAEALLRWHHPQTGSVPPDKFIALTEETGLICDIGSWVLDEAVACAQQWSALIGMPFQVSINKSPVEFMCREPMNDWSAALAASELARNCISVEITEGILLSGSSSVTEKLDRLQQAGVQLAIDDFGTGYSSMAYLKKFAVDYLKIDQSFVRDIVTSEDSRTIAETIIVMAHKLGLRVIAEGVETAEQRDWLREAHCDYAQGYLYSKPVPPQDFEKLLTRNKEAYQTLH